MSAYHAIPRSRAVQEPLSAIGFLGAALVLMVCASYAAAQGPPASDRTERDLRALTEQFNRAILARDKTTLQQLLATDYRFGRERLVSKDDQIRDIMTMAPFPDKQTVDAWDVQAFGDTAIVTGIATATYSNKVEGNLSAMTFRWVNVWVRRNGRWQVVYNQSTPLSFAKGNTAEP